MNARPTWTLTERTAAELPLTAADVEYLLAHHRAHVQLLPTRRPDLFRVTATGHVGSIPAPDCRLVLRPKIPIRNILYLLDPASDLPAFADGGAADAGGDVIDILAAELARALAARAAAGLRRGYRERAETGAFLQGRLDVAAQLRDPHGRRDQLHCNLDDFTPDVPCNQLPKATAERLLACPALGAAVRQALRHALAAFAEVQPVPLEDRLFADALADRLNQEYRPLLGLCRLLAEGLAPAAGALTAPAFLLNLERVFERFLLSRISGSFGGAAVQPWCRVEGPGGARPELALRPDLTLGRDGRPVLVLDAKWKRLPATRLVTADVYQVLAYCAALGVRRGVLVYPGKRDRAWQYELGTEPVRLTVWTLCVTGDRPRLERAVRRLLRGLRNLTAPDG
jgi:5-methylcytosine-specific restriction enzyme subunit McrC